MIDHPSLRLFRNADRTSMRLPAMRSPIMLGLCIFRKAEIDPLLFSGFSLIKKSDLNIWDLKSSFQSSSRQRSSSLFYAERNYKSSFVSRFLGYFAFRWCT